MYLRIDLIGNLVADAEVRTGKDGKEFISFRVAVNEYHGEEKRATYYDVSCRMTEATKNLKCGNLVFASGLFSVSTVNKDNKTYHNYYVQNADVRNLTPRE
jgi:single-stranded DNA-binding protein